MKKLVSIMVAVVMMISSVSVFGASLRIVENGPDFETVRGGCTYKVTVDNADHGLSFLVDTKFVIEQINLFFDKNLG